MSSVYDFDERDSKLLGTIGCCLSCLGLSLLLSASEFAQLSRSTTRSHFFNVQAARSDSKSAAHLQRRPFISGVACVGSACRANVSRSFSFRRWRRLQLSVTEWETFVIEYWTSRVIYRYAVSGKCNIKRWVVLQMSRYFRWLTWFRF